MKKLCLLTFLLLCYLFSNAQDTIQGNITVAVEPDTRPVNSKAKTMLAVSTVGLVGSYAATVLMDVAMDGQIVFPEILLPAAGPFIALLRYNSVVVNPYYTGRTTDKLLLGLSGVVQTVCLVGALNNWSKLKNSRLQSSAGSPSLSVGPYALGGVSIVYSF